MGAGLYGGFGKTRGGRSIYKGYSKQDALSSVSKLPVEIRKSTKSFFKRSSNSYNKFSVHKSNNERYILKMEKPGIVPGSKAVYYKILDSDGTLIRAYKETYAPDGTLVHTKEK